MKIRKFRPDIEGLRAIAVLSVVIAHSGIGLKGGFVGVDIFFVISGFLITSHLYKEAIENKTISLAQFYGRRILRILPASIFVLLATFLASYIWLSPLQLVNYAWDSLLSAFSLFNYRLAATGTNYFATTSTPSPFQHFWSLCVEEQFYFIWPLLMLILAKLFGHKQNFGRIVSGVLILIISISLYLSYATTSTSPTWAYFGLHTRAWQLAIGALLAVNIEYFGRIKPQLASILSWIGFGGLAYGLLTINEQTPYPSLWALIPTLFTALIIAAGVNKNKLSFESFFGHNIFQFIGKISYSWYLIHWPIFVIYLIAGQRNSLKDQILIVIVSFILAIVSYYIIENPIRQSIFLKGNLKRLFVLGAALILVVASIAGSVIYLKSKDSIQINNKIQLITDKKNLDKKIQEGLKLQTLPLSLSPTPQKAPDDFYIKPCFLERPNKYEEVKNNPDCVFGDKSSNKVIALIGDSHAHQWAGAVSKIAAKRGYKLLTFSKSTCPMMDIEAYSECKEYRIQVQEQLKKLKPEIIITTSFNYPESNPKSYSEFIQKLFTNTKKVIKIVDNSIPPFYVGECLVKNPKNIQNCTFDRKAIRYPETEKMENKIASDFGVQVTDVADLICGETLCPSVIDGIIVYMDNSHISNTYAEYISNLVGQKLFLEE